MTQFIVKTAVMLVIVMLCSSVAMADNQRSCYFAFGSGVTEQIIDYPGQVPNLNPNIGFLKLRIGGVLLEGAVDVEVTEGYNVRSIDAATGGFRITGFGKGTFDFGDLGEFYTWEVGTATLLPPFASSTLHGDIRTGPHRDARWDDPPGTWGEGFFENADVTFKGLGWNRFGVINDSGMLVNQFTYFLWGKVCDVDLRGIRAATRN